MVPWGATGMLNSRRISSKTSSAGWHRPALRYPGPCRMPPSTPSLGQLETLLIRFGILHDHLRLAVDGQDDRAAGLLELLGGFRGLLLEFGGEDDFRHRVGQGPV